MKPKDKEEKLERLNLVLRTIRHVNQLLVRERDRTRLFQGICNKLIENRGYYNAWIAVFDESGGLVTTAEAGLGKKFLPMIDRMKGGELTYCIQKALKKSGVFLTEDPNFACTDCPLSTNYAGRAGLTVRLEFEGKVFGIMTVSIPRNMAFDEEEQALFEEIGGDVAFALHDIELEERHKRADEANQEIMHQLAERVKELNCLFALSTLVEKRGISLEKILQGTVELIPPALQYPEITCARIILEGREFKTKNFEEKKWTQVQDIIVQGRPRGTLEVRYLEERPDGEECPFLKEERALINTIAERLGKVTERIQAQRGLLESEKGFRDLVENSLMGISILQNNQIVYQNPEQERLVGPLPRKTIFKDRERIHPDDVQKVQQFYEKIVRGDVQTLDSDFRFYHSSQTDEKIDMKWVYCRASLINYQGEEALLVNLMDMSHAKELENLLRIQDKMVSLGHVAAGIAHEIRNPLSGINIYLNTLEKIYERDENFDKVKGILGQLQSASRKIESVIRRVMDFSKPSEPKFVLTDINKPIDEALNLSAVTLRKRRIRTEKATAENLPLCQADPHLIEQVILNLITNAAEAMKKVEGEKIIGVSSFTEHNHIIVTVSDSGPGVPLELREKIFDPFYTTKNGSTGIGLSIGYRIIKDHGWSLRVTRSKWGGAEFVIEIPIEKQET